MGWTAQYFTTVIIQGNTPNTGLFIYKGAPGNGTLIGSWTANAGVDPFGNTYPAGINVFAGQLSNVTMTTPAITGGTILNMLITASNIVNPSISAGTIRETIITFDSGGGALFGYTSSTTSTSFTTSGIFNYTATATGTGNVNVWGGGAGADGSTPTNGGATGGAGEWAQEPAYPLVNGQQYQVIVGGGGTGGTVNGQGLSGGGSAFDLSNGGPVAAGGFANSLGAAGGTGSTATNHNDGGAGAAAGTSTGGSSGANSGSASGTGNAANQASTSSGAAAPSAQSGAGQGPAGGNNNANGAIGSAPGASGSAAGAGSAGSEQTFTYRLSASATYFGSDANAGAPPNGIRNSSNNGNGTMYQGGETASGGAFNGTMKSMGIISGNPAADLAGLTIDQVTIRLENLHSWYNSGMNIRLGYTANTSLPGSYAATGLTNVATLTIAEGAKTTFDITGDGLGNAMQAGTAKAIVLGPGSPFILQNYGYFYGAGGDNNQNPVITIKAHAGASSVLSGSGANGQVTVSQSSSQVLQFSLSPVATTDAFANAIPAGIAVLNPDGSFNRVRTEATDNTGSTANSASFIQVTKSWTIPANDPVAKTGYRLKAWGNGTWPAVAGSLNIRGNFTGAGGLGAIAIGAGEFSLSATFKWYMEVTIVIVSSTVYISYSLLTMAIASGGNQLTETGAQAAGAFMSTGGASGINTAANMTMWIEAEWVTNNGSLTCAGSTFTPIGA